MAEQGRKVQEELGRAQGLGRPRAPGEQRATAPRLLQIAAHRRPHRPSAGPGPGSNRQQSAADEEEAASCLAPGKEGRREGSWVALGVYLSPGSASSPACRTEKLVVQLEDDDPTRVTTIPPRAPHIAITATANTATAEPVRHRRSATGPPRAASMRSRPTGDTCDQQVPGRAAPPPASLTSSSRLFPPLSKG
ncbi:hypothetical protein P7K49_008189 [Saguinus oedipus]|uniref:Uncharacterized protein n=1 Tax=Saguinus oedipus TaxID=9490 RepID=A0ABQ9VX00_SAGOE|nr:hypothetical protein P7K49_008189 [Saguinus oedipus]